MKMRKNAVALSVAALIGGMVMVGGASAAVITAANTSAVDLRVNAGGIGHSLLVPYYTAQLGNSTLINIVNTDTTNGKAVKLRFRGASNSDDVLDFQLFLSPGDVWGANINRGANGLATINTTDNSCTLPTLVNGSSFVTARLPANVTGEAAATQTREGYVEIFNMADIRPGSALFTAIKHVNGVAPCGISANSFGLGIDPANEAAANARGLYAPSTGLFSNFGIINQVNGATSWVKEATSIVAVNGAPGSNGEFAPGFGNIVFSPQTSAALGTNVLYVTADPLLRSGAVAPLNFDAPDMSTPYTRLNSGDTDEQRARGPIRQASNLSMALATTSIRNEFLTASSIQAATDWTLSFPTRRYNVALDYRTNTRAFTNFATSGNAEDSENGIVRVNYFTDANTTVQQAPATGNFPQICVGAGSEGATTGAILSFYDTSERSPESGTDFVISPGLGVPGLNFCGEVSVLSFSQSTAAAASSVLNASITRNNVAAPYDAGWLTIATPGINGGGLPVLGSYYLKATNPANGNFSTNFGGQWEHRYQRPTPAVLTAN